MRRQHFALTMDGGDGVCSGGGNAMTKVAAGVTEAQGMQDLGTVRCAPLLLASPHTPCEVEIDLSNVWRATPVFRGHGVCGGSMTGHL